MARVHVDVWCQRVWSSFDHARPWPACDRCGCRIGSRLSVQAADGQNVGCPTCRSDIMGIRRLDRDTREQLKSKWLGQFDGFEAQDERLWVYNENDRHAVELIERRRRGDYV